MTLICKSATLWVTAVVKRTSVVVLKNISSPTMRRLIKSCLPPSGALKLHLCEVNEVFVNGQILKWEALPGYWLIGVIQLRAYRDTDPSGTQSSTTCQAFRFTALTACYLLPDMSRGSPASGSSQSFSRGIPLPKEIPHMLETWRICQVQYPFLVELESISIFVSGFV
jgi:hypothetical protein